MQDKIIVTGAKVHNLKDVTIEIPRNALTVFTGLSGSGKSSLAFDTIYAEGQRRYIESLSAYARQFLDQLDKPEVESIEGLSPAISIDQKSSSHNPRSTVGTITEIYDYLRLLYASIGKPLCPNCGQEIRRQSIQEIFEHVNSQPEDSQLTIFSPVISGKKGEHKQVFESIQKDGFSRVRLNGKILRLADDDLTCDKNKAHTIEIVVDRITNSNENKERLFDSIETACKHSNGLVLVEDIDYGFENLYSEQFSCADCNVSIAEITQRLFSFNSPYGACPSCNGLGDILDFDPELVVSDPNLPVKTATKKILNLNNTILGDRLEKEAKLIGFDGNTLVKDLNNKQRELLFYGVKPGAEPPKRKFRGRFRPMAPRYWEGVIGNLKRRNSQTYSEYMRFFFRAYMSAKKCESCDGQKLNKDARSVFIQSHNISELSGMNVRSMKEFFKAIKLTEKEAFISKQLLKEINERLSFLEDVGLHYMTVDRKANTLSGGELQRIRLATQIGSRLTGVLYVLDEPSIGLHQRDNDKLLKTLKSLRDLGNTLIVVEHDEETIRMADYVVDIGPLAGRHGGEIISAGTLDELLESDRSITAKYLTGQSKIEIPESRRQKSDQKYVSIIGAKENNLKNISVKLPLKKFIAVTGVSGSGKSTLINNILYKALMRHFHKSKVRPGQHKEIKGIEHIDKIINIDQSPIGKTPRSNPATYVGAFTPIRDLYAQTREAKIKGFKAGRFSFNVKGGRCENCNGDGLLKIEMNFLSDVYVTCDLCKGKRYNEQTLSVNFKGYTISDVLNMTVNAAIEVFENIPAINQKLQTLQDVGLGYITLGQSATTLSGGEAQRIKLAKELSKKSTGKTLYVLDEPTTGLHFADIKKLLEVLNRLVDGGNTVLVIEHNLDVVKTADHIIDLGPEGGDSGGQIIAEGTPEEIITNKASVTGEYLKRLLPKKKKPTKKQTVKAN